MHIKTALRSAAFALSALAVSVISGCAFYDLGDFENEEEYYASFGDVGLIAQNGTRNYYSVEKYFYNEKSVNDFEGDIVGSDEYIYFILPFARSVFLESFTIFVRSDSDAKVEYSMFVSDSIPTKIRNFSAPLYEQEKDEEGNLKYDEEGNPVYKELEYDDPPVESAVCTGSLSLKAEKWSSFTAEKWSEGGSVLKSIAVQSGLYLLIRFENNSGVGKDNGLEKISFSVTNMLVRVVENERNGN